MSDKLVFVITENDGNSRVNEFVQIGIPLPQGLFYETGQIHLHSDEQQALVTEVRSSALWPDKSIKWCLVGFLISIHAKEQKNIYLSKQKKNTESSNLVELVSEDLDFINIKTRNYTFQLGKNNFNFIDHIIANDKTITKNGFCRLVKEKSENLIAGIDKYHYRDVYCKNTPIYTELVYRGQFENASKVRELNFQTNLKFFYDSDRVNGSISLHNPNRALHPAGKWDLGDDNSILIDEFSIGMEVSNISEIQWKTEPQKKWERSASAQLSIFQESSGGTNWNSPNHKNKDNKIALKKRGYTCRTEKGSISGHRADPSISIEGSGTRINVKVHKFWQNFPKAVSISGGILDISLFPKQFEDDIELQAGEKKTHFFSLSIGDSVDTFDEVSSPLNIQIHLAWLKECNIFPNEYMDERTDTLKEIINEGLVGENSFFSKREMIDEYGWRNFGDLYADHEADLTTDSSIFVSHYNNQYDPIFGFLFQYLLSGDMRWFELADDLAKHVTDIDIYHTKKDKDEYNGGPFWHTDHYLDAATSSHRCYSKHHTYIYEGCTQGGGPGGQHCYTAGLLLHFLITGAESSKKAVFQLGKWIETFYEPSTTFCGFLVALKTSSYIDRKNNITGQYPLDRGTAYYINTMLDKYFLTGDKTDLGKVENIIRNTVSPSDKISERELYDIEYRWYYTVFLQSLIRYLKVKEEYSEIDADFYYARDALMIYAKWMVKNEYPYLEKPEILLYPNHTWTAQDIRKVHILYNAGLYSYDMHDSFLEKANEFYSYISTNLKLDPSRTYTRILSILMQNPISLYMLSDGSKFGPKYEDEKTYSYENKNSITNKMVNVFLAFFQVLKRFSINNEVQWLNKRTQLFSKFKRRPK